MHRDLAARNVLVAKDGTTCKVHRLAGDGFVHWILCCQIAFSSCRSVILGWPEILKKVTTMYLMEEKSPLDGLHLR